MALPRPPCAAMLHTSRGTLTTNVQLVNIPVPLAANRPLLASQAPVLKRRRPISAVAAPYQATDYKDQLLGQLNGGSRHMLRDSKGRLSLKNLTFKQLEAWCHSVGEPKRAVHLWRWLYADGQWMRSLTDTLGSTNAIAQKFIDAAEPVVTCDGGLELQQVVRSRDGTRKLIFKLTGGEAAGGTVETVLIPVVRSAGQKTRITLCVSTQVGCAQNCQFCYTGRMGLLGNLTTAQIVEQVVEARRLMAQEGDTTPLTNCVFMGMGEPLHNPEAVADAIEIMNHPLGLHMSHNKVTVSTVGLIPEIKRFVPRCQAQLAVSLHATTDEVRDWVVPINRRYPLAQLMDTLRELYPAKRSGLATQNQPSDHQQQQPAEASDGNQGSSVSELQATEPLQELVDSPTSIRWSLGRKRVPRRAALARRGPDADPGGTGGEGPEEERSGTLLIAYLMLREVNDTPEDAHRLLALLDGVAAKINLIIFNPHQGTVFLPSTDKAVAAFRSILVRGGRVCTIRDSKGDDEMAACGQLGDLALSSKTAPLLEPPGRFKEIIRRQQEERAKQQQQQLLPAIAA